MSKQELPNPKVSPASKVVDLGENRAERAEITRRQVLFEILKQMGREADRIAAPILNETELCLDELEQEETV